MYLARLACDRVGLSPGELRPTRLHSNGVFLDSAGGRSFESAVGRAPLVALPHRYR